LGGVEAGAVGLIDAEGGFGVGPDVVGYGAGADVFDVVGAVDGDPFVAGRSTTGSPCASQETSTTTTLPHTASSAAQAVHQATRRLRDRWPDHPQMWAVHIHAGA
jgi:hypothetical protein